MAGVGKKLVVAVAAVAWWLVSCRDISDPEGGVQSISQLILPSPGLVAGDTLRDSLGLVAPLEVIAFGVDNDPLDPQPPKTFVVLDTGAHLVGGQFLVGDTPGTTVRIVGSVLPLQTQPSSVKVTLSPDTLEAADATTTFIKNYALSSGDTVIASPELAVLVRHLGVTVSGVEAVIVRYTIDQSPASLPGAGPLVVLVNGNTRSDRDTTDANGRAARVLRLRTLAIPTGSALRDTALVTASASYRGAVIGTVQFTIVYNGSP